MGDTSCGQSTTTRNLIFGIYTQPIRGYDLEGDASCGQGTTTRTLIFGIYTEHSRLYCGREYSFQKIDFSWSYPDHGKRHPLQIVVYR